MGDRISIQFKDAYSSSPVLFSHWDGLSLIEEVENYLNSLILELEKNITPLGRLEPPTVMVDFIRNLTKNMNRVERNYYFGKDEFDGDNSDNGHHIFILNSKDMEWSRE